MQPVKHAVHGLCVGDGRPVVSHFGGVTVMTSFLNSSPSHSCIKDWFQKKCRFIDTTTDPGVHNAKAEECTTPYMHQNILVWVVYMATKVTKNSPAKISWGKNAQAVYQLPAAIPDEYQHF